MQSCARNLPNCLRKRLCRFAFSPGMKGSSCCSQFLLAFGIASVLDFGHFNGRVVASHCWFDLHFPDDRIWSAFSCACWLACFLFFLKDYSFILRETETAWVGRGRERGREGERKRENPKQASHCQRRAWHGAQTLETMRSWLELKPRFGHWTNRTPPGASHMLISDLFLFGEMSVKVLGFFFLIRLLVFSLLSFKSSWYILDNSPASDVSFANISPHTVIVV